MRLATVLALLLVVGFCVTPAMAGKDDPVKSEGDPRLPVDFDYYQISLTAGVQVIIETMASPVCDPDVGDTKLYLYGPNSCTTGGTGAMYNDDISYPSNAYSRITYTPTVSGIFYIKAQGYSSSYEGCYKMTIMCAGVTPTTLVDEVEPNDTCGATVQTLTCDNYVHGRIGVVVATGACCTPCGICTVTTQAACLTPNVWHGEWLSCTPNQCVPTTPIPVNDTCAGAILLECGQGIQVQGSLACATGDYDPTAAGCTTFAAVGPDVTYKMVLNEGDVVTAAYTAYVTSFDSSIYLVTDCANVLTSCVAGSDTYPNPPGESLTYTVPAGGAGTYYLIMDKYGTSTADGFTLTYSITCPAATGACCAPDGSCTVTAETACAAPSVWHGEWATCDVASCPVSPIEAACCFADGHCELLTEAACMAAPDHIAWLPGVVCPPTANPCPQPGACCDALTGNCTFVQELSCPQGWTWLAGVACLPDNPCPPPVATAACCDPMGNCTVTTQEACLAPNMWHPEWVGCVPNYCPPPVPAAPTTWGQIKSNYR